MTLYGPIACVSPTHNHRIYGVLRRVRRRASLSLSLALAPCTFHEARASGSPFRAKPVHNIIVLRVTSPTLHSGSGALFGNDLLTNYRKT